MKKYGAMIDFLRGRSSGLPRLIAGSAVTVVLGLGPANGASAGVVVQQSPVGGNDAFPSVSAAQTADDFVLSANTSVSGLVGLLLQGSDHTAGGCIPRTHQCR